MKAKNFWTTVVADESDFLGRLLGLLSQNGVKFCLIGGQAVNAYTEPLVSLDLDIVIAADQLESAEAALAQEFEVEHFPHSINLSAPGSDLRVQVQTDPRYFDFVDRAEVHEVLGVPMPVAAIADILQGKVWAASDPGRRPSKRLKDLADIARLLETRPDLRTQVPQELLDRIQ